MGNVERVLKSPIWALALLTGAKSFRENPILGSARLNALGLHTKRATAAHDLASWRRQRLRHLVSEADAASFARDGFVVRPEFLAPQEFTHLRKAIVDFRGSAREMVQGDAITRRIALDRAALRALPEVRALLDRPDWRGLMKYVGSFDYDPIYYVQTIINGFRVAAPDPQTQLHADTFHPTLKAWFFLTDVAADEGPFVYVPGSHRLTPERLAWEREKSMTAAGNPDRLTARGSFRVSDDDLRALGLPAPKAFAVAANTLVVADTVGFHARGPSARPSKRLEIWAYGRRNPFLPWTGMNVANWFGLTAQRAPLYWRTLDLAERIRLRGNPWRNVGVKQPLAD